jgi:ATP-dependent RNA helicase DDX19/DBP5
MLSLVCGVAGEKATAADSSLFNHLLRSKLVDSKNTVEVQRKNPNSPLYSVKSFEELHLHSDLLKGVYGMGFNRPSKIQEQALPILLSDPPCNLIAQSQSGTGKTAAFVLAMLSRVDLSKQHPQVICLSPTFDLAQQTGNVLTHMAQYLPVRMVYAVRGSRVDARVERKEQIVMGTAGTMLDWVLKKKVIDAKKIKMFVLDEADVMIDQQGQQDQTIRIQRQLPKECQMVLFSATYNEEVMKFASMVIPDPVIMRLKRNEESLDNIKQFYVACASEDAKFEALCNLYGVVSIGQAMVFCHVC